MIPGIRNDVGLRETDDADTTPLDRRRVLEYPKRVEGAIWAPSTARLEPRQARKGATVEKSGCDGPFPAPSAAGADWSC